MTRTIALKLNTFNRKLVFTTLVTLALSCIGGYAYLLNLTIAHGIAVERGEKSVALLNTEVGNLEEAYFKAKSAVTLSRARALGFADAGSQSVYLSRGEKSKTLSLSTR